MSGETSHSYSSEVLLSDKVLLDLLPEKKGFIKKHAEYLITYDGIGTQVCRRYSDFMALQELLQSRFPYRLLPRLPPQALTAFVSGNDSDFAEARRKALKRWINFVVTHPILSNDPMVKFFFNYVGDNAATRIRDEFRCLPDEFINNEIAGMTATRDFKAKPDLKKQIESSRVQLSLFSNFVGDFVAISVHSVERSMKESSEMSDLAKELSNLPALPALGEPGAASASGWGPLQKSSQQLSKCFMSLSTSYSDNAHNQGQQVVEAAKTVQDVLTGYKDLCEHIFSDKAMIADHKRAAEKMTNIKKKVRIQGSFLGENPDEYNRLERHLEKNHFELSDLENRRSYSLLALAQETKLVVHVTELLGVAIQQLTEVQISGLEKNLVNYRQIKEAAKDLRKKQILIK